MKKIGIVTLFYENFNYGGILQAYALQTKIKDRGVDVNQIAYKKQMIVPKEKKNIVYSLKNLLIKIIKRLLRTRINARKNNFRLFVKDYIECTNVMNKSNIHSLNLEYDAFITGSDQVWNPKWFDSTYLLDFANDDKLKFSYAASIGIDKISDKDINQYTSYLNRFDLISVREENLQKQLDKVMSKKITQVVDPTMILTKEEWESITIEPKLNEKYIFCYFLGSNKNIRNEVSKFAKEKGLKIVSIPFLTGFENAGLRFGDIRLYETSPQEFLGLIKNANYVVTDSFHGTVFSLLFEKSFSVFKRGENGNLNQNSRLYSILKKVDLLDHFVKDKNELCVVYNKKIDYCKVSNMLKTEVEISIKYIDDILKKVNMVN